MNENQENETVPSAESKADVIRREIKTYVCRIRGYSIIKIGCQKWIL